MSVDCAFCGGPVNPHDLGVWKEVAGWVGGPRKDAMTMRDDTGRYAHAACIDKAKAGQDAAQPDLFAEDKITLPNGAVVDAGPDLVTKDESLLHELFDEEPRSFGEGMGHPGGHYG